MINIYLDGVAIFNQNIDDLKLYGIKLNLELGKAGSFEFIMPPEHRYINEIKQIKSHMTVELDSYELFRGRILSITRKFDNTRVVFCEGDIAYLVDSVFQSRKYDGTTHDLFRCIISNHNSMVEKEKRFAVGTINIPDTKIHLSGISEETEDNGNPNYNQININSNVNEWKSSLEFIQSCILSQCGGYLRSRRENETTYIDIISEFTNISSQKISFGKNMLDMIEELSVDDLFTVLIPIGDNNLTIAGINDGKVELIDDDGIKRFGRIVKTKVFNNVTIPETLMQNALSFMKSRKNIPISINVKALDLHFTDKQNETIKLGDRVAIDSEPHSIAEYLTCTKISYDFDNPANNVYTLGVIQSPFTERYKTDKIERNNRESYPETSMRSGGGGGGSLAAEKKSKEETEESLKKFYDAYIGLDKEHGDVSLYGLYKELQKGKEVLKSQCGIYIDADPEYSNVNINNIYRLAQENSKSIIENKADITTTTNKLKSEIDISTSYTKKIENETKEKIAEIKLTAEENSSKINLKADITEINGLRTEINTKTTNINSELVEMNNALLKVKAIAAESIQSKLAKLERVNIKSLSVTNTLSANSIYMNGSMVATMDWVNYRFATKDDLKNYALKNHTHAHRHNHVIYINGKRYETGYTTP